MYILQKPRISRHLRNDAPVSDKLPILAAPLRVNDNATVILNNKISFYCHLKYMFAEFTYSVYSFLLAHVLLSSGCSRDNVH